ncbi:MAG: sensor histidine kinase [Acidimicrobiia bacterium]
MARAAAFVGEDRRRVPAPAGRAWMFAGGSALVLGAVAALAAFAAAGDPLGASHARHLRLVLDTATVVLALGVAVLGVARRQLAGEVPPLLAGAGAAVYGLVGVGLAGVGPTLGVGGRWVTAAGQAAVVTTLAALAAGLLAPAVDTRLRSGRVLAGAAALVAGLWVAFGAAPGAGQALTVAGVGAEGTATRGVAWIVAVGWLCLAGALVVKGFRRPRVYAWCGVLAFALLLAELAGAAASAPGDRWAVAAAALRAIGFAVAAGGCALELGGAYADQRSRLFDSQLTLEAAAVSERLEKASRRAQRHDVRNAVVAIEGAAVTLERYRERLSAEDRSSLTRVLSSGVQRLQGLLDDGRSPATVDLAAAAVAVVADLGWAGRVIVQAPPDLVGIGRATQTAEVVRLLLDNADKRAPGKPIAVDGRVDGGWAVLRVSDQGPQMSLQGRRSANARVDAPAAGSGEIGLLVAGRLMREQGGDLWVEESAAGGAFALCLPVPASAADGA